jgi:hypothetical protein
MLPLRRSRPHPSHVRAEADDAERIHTLFLRDETLVCAPCRMMRITASSISTAYPRASLDCLWRDTVPATLVSWSPAPKRREFPRGSKLSETREC